MIHNRKRTPGPSKFQLKNWGLQPKVVVGAFIVSSSSFGSGRLKGRTPTRSFFAGVHSNNALKS